MNGQKNATIFDASFESLGFIFRNTHAYQGPRYPTGGSANSGTRKSSHDRTGGDEWAESWNGKGANTGEPSERPTQHSSTGDSRGRAFGCLCVLFVCEILCT